MSILPPGERRRRLWPWVLVVLLLAVGGVLLVGWYHLFREEPQQFALEGDALARHKFLYGSIGTEAEEGVPYRIWLVLPRLFPEHLPGPGGYASLGIVWQEGEESPVGFSRKVIGFPRIGINCALCHSGSYRTDPEMPSVVVPGAPATRIDAQGYLRFLARCGEDPRFTADNILPAIGYDVQLSPVEKALYRHVIIPRTRDALRAQSRRYQWTLDRPRWGRGRIDPFNPVKFHQLGLSPDDDPSIGNSDMMPIWEMAGRQGQPLHWDGLNDSLTEVVLTGAIGDGATARSLPVRELGRLEEWLRTLKPPKYPFDTDPKLVKEGEAVFAEKCAACHAPGGKETGQVIALPRIGTDGHRLEMWTRNGRSAGAEVYNRAYSAYPWGFQHFVKTEGYVSVPLNGIWLRAPYLHNGSVPTLEDLLEPAEKRPRIFYRGYDLVRPGSGGFVHRREDILAADPRLRRHPDRERLVESLYFRFDTSVPGNGNGGHTGEAYGTGLPPGMKRALVEYLKTL